MRAPDSGGNVGMAGAETMSAVGDSNLIGGLITAGLTSAVALISVLTQWRAYGRALRDHSQEIDQDMQVVKFWEEWMRVRLACTGEAERAEIEARVRRELDSLPLFPTRELLLQRVNAPHLLSRVFLAYPPRHPAIWLARSVYYTLAIITLYALSLLGVFLVAKLGSALNQAMNPKEALGVAIYALILGLIACVVRFAALKLDGPPPQAAPPRAQGPGAASLAVDQGEVDLEPSDAPAPVPESPKPPRRAAARKGVS